jgi:CheY-like chemotaxis protein
VDVRDIVHQAIETCRAAAESAGHELVVELPQAPVVLDADPARLVQVLGNLLMNAIRYTGNGGCITLSVERGADDVTIRVADTGIGIPPEMLGRVFEMFTQVEREPERAQGGLGIGLSLVRWLVQMHGGVVDAASDGVGRGSTFTVRLPLAAAGTQAANEATAAPRAATGLRVLVADDNADSADSLARVLELDGHTVHIAHDGEQAVAAAREFRADAVLLDIGMPRLDGFAACRAIRAAAGAQPPLLIAVTGWGQDEDRRRTLDAGFDMHLVKPVDLAALGALLADHGAGRPA